MKLVAGGWLQSRSTTECLQLRLVPFFTISYSKLIQKIQELYAKQNYETKSKKKNHENTEEMWHRKPLK